MCPITSKKETKSKYTAKERYLLAEQSPFFVKKKEDAEAFIKKAGLPERLAYKK
jgi:hypothetical protein